jgi:hypothetical protein
MSITIIIEDGTNVANANSYVSISDTRDYATNRGISLPISDDEVASLIIKSTDYLETKQYQGTKTYSDQSLLWPRSGVTVDCLDFAVDQIPKNLKLAQYQLVIAANQGIELLPNIQAGDFVKREKIGVIETEYADPLSIGLQPSFTGVDSLLSPLIYECGQVGLAIRTIRV